MKTFQLLIFSLLIIELSTQNSGYTCEGANKDKNFTPSEDSCMVLSTSEDNTHCCYVIYDTDSECWELSDDEYENIKRFKEVASNRPEWTDNIAQKVKIKCSSNFIANSLLLILIFILL